MFRSAQVHNVCLSTGCALRSVTSVYLPLGAGEQPLAMGAAACDATIRGAEADRPQVHLTVLLELEMTTWCCCWRLISKLFPDLVCCFFRKRIF
jgi:hypothetical protein